jgi:hypothetical protein
MRVTLFTSIIFFIATFTGKPPKGFFYCIDHPGKMVYYSTGDVVIKKGLEKNEYYQYGFMKWNGWINKSWEGLEYDLRFFPAGGFDKAGKSASDSLTMAYRARGYQVKVVPMPYPMKPFRNYKKDGSN